MSSISVLRFPRQTPAGITSLKKARRKYPTVFLPGRHALIISFIVCLFTFAVFHFCLGQRESSLNSIEQANTKLRAENRELTKEWSHLTSPERIASLAKNKLGLQYPSKEQVIYMR